jgi:hypothetical protein
MEAKGKTGSICLSEDAVTVSRRGVVRWRESVPAIERRIPLDQILAVHLRSASALGTGCIEFVVDGWARGENAIYFSHRQQAVFEELSNAIASKIEERLRAVGRQQ